MAIPLSLGVPRSRGPQSLIAELLSGTGAVDPAAGGALGPRVVPASALLGAVGTDAGRVIVCLDVDPARLRTSEQASYEAVRFHLDCPADQLGDAVTLRLPSPLAVFVTRGDSDELGLAETAQHLADAGRIPGLASGHSIGEVADFLAVLAHADVGYVARVRDTAEVLALLSGTVASLRGDDVRAALAAPDPATLTALIPEAAEAVREVLLGVEVHDPVLVASELSDAGLR
ncbi:MULTISPECIES: hypothetical protein [unclassified Rhodococcus (in: high G+C Gram-positive bacteria)]|uniref:hypothetical protein n=1 Tax=unclassified Rhodococcus (in: high G+C Gram-positive bacteria) TaxID=192944 RepID=UPI00163A5B26|nr:MULTISPECIES: hypothetical protein [unclassified Rhodococcus (in: high G+C Gram-positive bacteria)]MBC2641386.1 hypothetical protein [Rhodococcus sp. 3A]MBC2893869.1 hypothetical protein [Rhodococcus sp. 4CII]